MMSLLMDVGKVHLVYLADETSRAKYICSSTPNGENGEKLIYHQLAWEVYYLQYLL